MQGKVQPDRFSGGLRLNVQQVWDLAAARCRFGKYLRVAVNGSVPPVAEVLRDFPRARIATEQGELPQGLPVRLALHRTVADDQRERRARPRRRRRASTRPTPRSTRWRAGAHARAARSSSTSESAASVAALRRRSG